MINWFRIDNAGSRATIRIYDYIGKGGVTAASFIKEFNALNASSIEVRINSNGGEIWSGLAIHHAIAHSKAHVTTYVDGVAASIASIILQAGHARVVGQHAQVMIHNPSVSGMEGEAKDLRKQASLLDSIRDRGAAIYAERSGDFDTDWAGLMDRETWFNAAEAVEFGLADRIDTLSGRVPNATDRFAIYNYAGRREAPTPVRTRRGSDSAARLAAAVAGAFKAAPPKDPEVLCQEIAMAEVGRLQRRHFDRGNH